MGEQLKTDPPSSTQKERDTPFLKKTKLFIGILGITYLGGQLIGLYRLDPEVNLRVSGTLFLAMGLVLFARGIKQKTADLTPGMNEVQEDTNDDPA